MQDLVLHVRDIHDDERQFCPPEHAEADHQALVPGHTTCVFRRQARRANLDKKKPDCQGNGVRQYLQHQLPVEDQLCAKLDKEDRAYPEECGIVDDNFRFLISAFNPPDVDAGLFCLIDAEVLFLDDQARHICADGRMKAEVLGHQTDHQGNQQNDQRRITSVVEGQHVLYAEPPDNGYMPEPAGRFVRKYPGTDDCDDNKENRRFAARYHQARHADRFVAGGKRNNNGQRH